jgi:transcriptional regulator GlxA family with amidase domain
LLPDRLADAHAKDLLATTDLCIAAIARRTGYESEEAFSRAFERANDVPPAAWRSTHRASRNPRLNALGVERG